VLDLHEIAKRRGRRRPGAMEGNNRGVLLGGKHDAHPGGDPATPFQPRPRQRGVSDEALQPAELLEPFRLRAADVNRRVADDEVLLITLGTMEHERPLLAVNPDENALCLYDRRLDIVQRHRNRRLIIGCRP